MRLADEKDIKKECDECGKINNQMIVFQSEFVCLDCLQESIKLAYSKNNALLKVQAENSLKQDDIRIIKKFAWLPIKIENKTKWLETVYIAQKFKECLFIENHRWISIKFVKKSEFLLWLSLKDNAK